LIRAALLAAAIALAAAAPAAATPRLVEIGRFSSPVHVASPPNESRVFVVEQEGRIRIAGGGTFLDISDRVLSGGERGLLSMAFSPDYAASGLFYVFYTAVEPEGQLTVSAYRRADASHANPTAVRTILRIPHASAPNHNGGQLQFGRDGMLYVSTGDGGDTPEAAASTGTELGKILRIVPTTGAAAPGNPFGNRVWAYGLRNPWRFTFDRATGEMLIGDVGQNEYEEVDRTSVGGRDFGWPACEGFHGTGPCGTRPAFERPHSAGYCAIVGGHVVRDPGLPTLRGRYLYGDLCLDSLRSVALPNTGDRAEPLAVSSLSSFGEDRCGRLYAASLGGAVYRIQDGAATPCPAAAGPDPTPLPERDLAAPRVNVAIRGLRRAVERRRVLVVLKANEACAATIGTRLRRVRRLRARHRELAAGVRKVVRVRMSRATARRLKRAVKRRGSVRVRVTVRATDTAGNVRRVTRRARIRRA
jgi:Glucose / Sorbosone dehydrogenase